MGIIDYFKKRRIREEIELLSQPSFTFDSVLGSCYSESLEKLSLYAQIATSDPSILESEDYLECKKQLEYYCKVKKWKRQYEQENQDKIDALKKELAEL